MFIIIIGFQFVQMADFVWIKANNTPQDSPFHGTTHQVVLLKAMVTCDPSMIAVATSVITSSDTDLCALPTQIVNDPASLNFVIIFLG